MKGSLVSAKNENRFLTDADRSDQSPQGIIAAVWCCDQLLNKRVRQDLNRRFLSATVHLLHCVSISVSAFRLGIVG